MKKTLLLTLIVFLFCLMLLSDNTVRLLRVTEPTSTAKDGVCLYFNLKDLLTILDDPELKACRDKIQIRLYDNLGGKLVKLGTMKKGCVKWFFKQVNQEYLAVKMPVENREMLMAEVRRGQKETNYQLGFTCEQKKSDTLKILKLHKLTFSCHMDLYAVLIYPLYAAPGENLNGRITVEVFNEGILPAKDFFVELVLSRDDRIPLKPGVSSQNFNEDMLIQNGRFKIDLLEPGKSIKILANSNLILPKDILPGKYQLGAVIDPENRIEESNKTNNLLNRLFIISMDPLKEGAKLKSDPIDLTKQGKLGQKTIQLEKDSQN